MINLNIPGYWMNLVCINCPRGCKLVVENINGEIKVTGNFCPRGEKYAISELTNPLRTLTTTLPIKSELYKRLPVISSAPLPKAKVIDAVKALKDVEVTAPIKMGDIVVEDILGLGIDIVASKSIDK